MTDTTTAIIFIIGKAAIWLVIPLLFGIYEMRKHRGDMKRQAHGETASSSIPAWLRAQPRQASGPATPQPSPAADPKPLPIAARREGAEEAPARRAA